MENVKIKNIVEQLTKDEDFIKKISEEDFQDVELIKAIIDYNSWLYKKMPIEIKEKEEVVEHLLSKFLRDFKYSDFPQSIRENRNYLLKIIKISSIKLTRKDLDNIGEKYKLDKEFVEYLCIFNPICIIDGYFNSPLFENIDFLKEVTEKYKNEHIFNRFALHKIPKKYVTKELVLALCDVDEDFYQNAFIMSEDKEEALEILKKMKCLWGIDSPCDSNKEINNKMTNLFRRDEQAWKIYFSKLSSFTLNNPSFAQEMMDCLIENLEGYEPAKDFVKKIRNKIEDKNAWEEKNQERESAYEKEKVELVVKYYSEWEKTIKKLLPEKDLKFIEIMVSDSKEGEYVRQYFFKNKNLNEFKHHVCQEYDYSIKNKYENENYVYYSDVSRKKLFSNIVIFNLYGHDTLLVSYCDGYFVATDTEGMFSGCSKNIWETPLFATEKKLSKKYEEFCENLGFKFENSQKYVGKCIVEWTEQNREEARILRKKKEKEFLKYITRKEYNKFWNITEKKESNVKLTEIEQKIYNEGNHYNLSNRHFISYDEYVFELTENGFINACLEISTLPYVLNNYNKLKKYKKFCDKNLIAVSAFKGHNGKLMFASGGDYINTPELYDYWCLLERKARTKIVV